jgi:hypothetical protein
LQKNFIQTERVLQYCHIGDAMEEKKLNFFDYLKILKESGKSALLSREGRKYLFGIGSAEVARIRRLNSEALSNFQTQFPEVDVHGNMTDFDGGVQYVQDGIRQFCQLREKYEIESTFKEIRQYPDASDVSKFYVSEGEIRQIPNTFIEYKNYIEFINYYNRSLNIVLADLWLHKNFPELFDLSKFNKDRKTRCFNKETNIFDFLKLISDAVNNGWIPVKNISSFFRLDREDMLLAVSRVLSVHGEKSTLNEYGLNFNYVDESHFFLRQDIYDNDGAGIEFWSRIIFYKMNSSFDVYEDKPKFHDIFRLMRLDFV